MLLHARGKLLARLSLFLVRQAHEAVPFELLEQRPRRLEDPRFGRSGVAKLLADATEREGHEVGQEESQLSIIVGCHSLTLAFLLVELEQQREQQALVSAPEVEEIPL